MMYSETFAMKVEILNFEYGSLCVEVLTSIHSDEYNNYKTLMRRKDIVQEI